MFLGDELQACGIVLEILIGVCSGVLRPNGVAIADRLLFAVAALAAEVERELIRERTLDRLPPVAASQVVLVPDGSTRRPAWRMAWCQRLHR